MRVLYNLSLYIYLLLIRIASLFLAKARHWLDGRKEILKKMREASAQDGDRDTDSMGSGQGSDQQSPETPLAGSRTIWFHCASLGEFEQGRPVLERFRERHPDWRILLTFFSPSGFEIRKNYAEADHVFYLPLDTPPNAKAFLDIWKPEMAVFVKYEFWFNYLGGLSQRGIPVLIISAIFRKNQHFFRFYGGWFRKQLKHVTRFFVQDEASRKLLERHGIQQVQVSGDTRFDRVYQLSRKPGNFTDIARFARGGYVMVAGSTWPKDEALVRALIRDGELNMKFIIAPHEVHRERIDRLMDSLGEGAIKYSEYTESAAADAKVLVIDRIGMLSRLYQYGHLAYIGGGFGQGIHNILEAAAFGLPVLFGPNYHKFAEARDLVANRGAFCVHNEVQLWKKVAELTVDAGRLRETGDICRGYVESKHGATDVIISYIERVAGAR
ncbi:MAG: 3-deoxy-D-manno-octulosonic acid transferase [Bacteroidales bacterium]